LAAGSPDQAIEAPRPLGRLTLCVSQQCNLACAYCYGATDGYMGTRQRMPAHTALKAVRTCAAARHIRHVQFFGGEPLLNRQCIYVTVHELESMHRQGILPSMPSLSMATNLTLMDEDMARFMAEKNMQAATSLDGPQVIHDRLRTDRAGKGSHGRVMHGLDLLRKHGVPFTLECTYTTRHFRNGHDIPGICDYLHAQRPHRFDIVLAAVPGNASLDPSQGPLWHDILRSHTESLEHVLDVWAQGETMRHGLAMDVLRSERPEPETFCTAGSSNVAVAADGGCYPCHMMIGMERFRSESPLQTLRAGQPCRKPDFAACAGCHARDLCVICVGKMLMYAPEAPRPHSHLCEFTQHSLAALVRAFDARMPALCDNKKAPPAPVQ
jgi:uncharacterized protein